MKKGRMTSLIMWFKYKIFLFEKEGGELLKGRETVIEGKFLPPLYETLQSHCYIAVQSLLLGKLKILSNSVINALKYRTLGCTKHILLPNQGWSLSSIEHLMVLVNIHTSTSYCCSIPESCGTHYMQVCGITKN